MTDIEYLKRYYQGNLESALKKLDSGYPLQYIVGEVDFYGNILKVNENVLIPRFETEMLVELTKSYIDTMFKNEIDILDIGTGSGCIAITLKKLVNSRIDAIDISKPALEVARSYSILNGTNINFFESDIFSNVNKKYDVIISNPPYIDYNEEISDIVKNNEPHIALYAKDNGAFYYAEILKSAKKYIKDKYLIAFEIGYKQGGIIKNLAYKYLDNVSVDIKKDLNGFDRFVFIKSNAN